ncbi:hypothetical protein F7725_021537 [Dissostichus mawsoni]|uniref:CCHC-type domain-containing protein n=1 Tax=Dissostichus mawsoni TaxID=36200 RepID=A0A7J5ZFJ4_DISMA|nr:hypothetical protein F7725_021537 [Dissostichus mawsoni]
MVSFTCLAAVSTSPYCPKNSASALSVTKGLNMWTVIVLKFVDGIDLQLELLLDDFPAEPRPRQDIFLRHNCLEAQPHPFPQLRKSCARAAQELRKSCARAAQELRKSCARAAQELRKSCARAAQELRKSCVSMPKNPAERAGFASNHLEYIFAYPGKKIFEVIFTTSQHFQNCLERFEKKKTSVSCLDKISMTPLAERDLKTVYVVIFPEKVRNQDVWTWMTRHCEVQNAIEVMDIDGIKTGSRRFQVRLQRQDGVLRHIPNTIQLGAFRGSVFYYGQPKECRKCGSLDHLAADCSRNICRICKATDHTSANCPTPVKCNLCSSENHRFKDCPHAYSNRVKHSPFEILEAREEERATDEPELSQASCSGTNQEPIIKVSQQQIEEPIQDQEKETSEGESIIDWSADTVDDLKDTTYIPLPMAHATVQKADPLPNHHPGTRKERIPGTLQEAENTLEAIMANITTPPPQGKQVLREDTLIQHRQIKDARDSPSRKRLQESPQSDTYRAKNANLPGYTWSNGKTHSRIDFLLTSKGLQVINASVKPVFFSDHAKIDCLFDFKEKVIRGRGSWKMNTSLLENPSIFLFDSVGDWWEEFKVRTKSFFIEEGKKEAKKKRYKF